MTDPIETPQLEAIRDALGDLKARVDAPESHGILCGMLSAGGQVADRDWLRQLVPEEESEAGASEVLEHLYRSTVWQLDDPQFSFNLLLPDDDENLGERTEALAHWCSGFLYGLGVSGVTESTQLPGEAAEVLGDLAKIASVDYELEEPSEAEERAYEEVVEYVRVGAMLVFESLRGPRLDESVH